VGCHHQAHIAQVAISHWSLAVTMTEQWLNSHCSLARSFLFLFFFASPDLM
jgi:hypothetical protein